jgi:hypothetical protein
LLGQCVGPANLERRSVLNRGVWDLFLGYWSFMVVLPFPLSEEAKVSLEFSTKTTATRPVRVHWAELADMNIQNHGGAYLVLIL